MRVNKSPDGFFVAGSALEGINGLYGRVKTVPQRLAKSHSFQLAYKHDQSNWYMALVECPLDHMGNKAEWLFIDDEGRDRFAHVGDTVVPGVSSSVHTQHTQKKMEKTNSKLLSALFLLLNIAFNSLGKDGSLSLGPHPVLSTVMMIQTKVMRMRIMTMMRIGKGCPTC